jgi:hypothetical protein
MKARTYEITVRGATATFIDGKLMGWETVWGFGINPDPQYQAFRQTIIATTFDEIDATIDLMVAAHPIAEWLNVSVRIDKTQGAKPRGFKDRYEAGANIVHRDGLAATAARKTELAAA